MPGSLMGSTTSRALDFEVCEWRLVLAGASFESLEIQPDLSASSLEQTLRRLHQDYQLMGQGQTVVVIDTGIAYDHIALGGGLGTDYQVVGGWDFSPENDADPYDDAPAGFHGTHVAGIIASQDEHHPGLAPQVDLVALRVFDDNGRSDFQWIEKALAWVHDHRFDFENPITTVNLSIAVGASAELSADNGILEDELAQLHADGIFVSVAAGNGFDRDPQPGVSYPASSPWVVPVGSVDAQGELSGFSRRQSGILVAPGENVVSTVPDYLHDFNGVTDDWYAFSGTSQAAPFVAGAAVLVREALERIGAADVSPNRILQILQQTGQSGSDSLGQLYYSVDVLAAVESLLPYEPIRDQGHDSLEVNSAASEKVAGVDFVVPPDSISLLDDINLLHGETWFQVQAVRKGVLRVSANDDEHHLLGIELYDTQGNLIASNYDRFGTPHVDVGAVPFETFVARLVGEAGTADVSVSNVASWAADGTLQINVPREIQQVQLDVGATTVLRLDEFQMTVSNDASVDVQLRPHQSLTINGAPSNDTFYARTTQVDVVSNQQTWSFFGGARVQLNGDAQDELILYGSSGNDRFVRKQHVSRLATPTRTITGLGFSRVLVFGGGGEDVAELHGTNSDDLFVGNSDYARLTSDDRLTWVEDFTRVYAYAQPAGVDRAFLYGSQADDSLAAYPDATRLASGDHLLFAEAFDRVYAAAGPGGLDRAYLHGSDGDDQFDANPEAARLTGDDFLNVAAHFDRVYAYAHGGNRDTARLAGSDHDDSLLVKAKEASLGDGDYHLGVYQFDFIQAQAGQGGHDRARIVLDENTPYARLTLAEDWLQLAGLAVWDTQAFDDYAVDVAKSTKKTTVLDPSVKHGVAVDYLLAPEYTLVAPGFDLPF